MELFGFAELVWCDGSTRKMQARCTRIVQGTYAVVLSATGFQTHAVDKALSSAAAKGEVRFVRVDRGRPAACVQAIARDLGLAAG